MKIKLYKIIITIVFSCLAFPASGSAQQNCSDVNEYPSWPAKDWPDGDFNHANGGDRMVHQGKLYQANWYTSTVPGSGGSWTLIGSCSGVSSSSSSSSNSSSTSSSSTSSSSSSSGSSYGSSCRGDSDKVVIVSSTIRVDDGGIFDGGCATYKGAGPLSDDRQTGDLAPIFRVGPGLIRNVYIGNDVGEGIHSRNGGDVENIHWSDVGGDGMSIRSPTNGATVTATRIEGYDSTEEFLRANDDGKWVINDCRVDRAENFLGQNRGRTFPLHVEVSNCYISNVKEAVLRSDSPNSTARITNSRLENVGDICIGAWKSCSSSNISN